MVFKTLRCITRTVKNNANPFRIQENSLCGSGTLAYDDEPTMEHQTRGCIIEKGRQEQREKPKSRLSRHTNPPAIPTKLSGDGRSSLFRTHNRTGRRFRRRGAKQ
jgi:hypothetical protein